MGNDGIAPDDPAYHDPEEVIGTGTRTLDERLLIWSATSSRVATPIHIVDKSVTINLYSSSDAVPAMVPCRKEGNV